MVVGVPNGKLMLHRCLNIQCTSSFEAHKSSQIREACRGGTDAWRPISRLWIRSAEFWGNVIRRMGTQQQRLAGEGKLGVGVDGKDDVRRCM